MKLTDEYGYLKFAPMMGLMLIGVALVTTGCIYGVNGASHHSCRAFAAQMNVPHHYDMWSGCFVTINGKQIPADAYRVISQ